MKLLKLRPRAPINGAVNLESKLRWALAEYTLESEKKKLFSLTNSGVFTDVVNID